LLQRPATAGVGRRWVGSSSKLVGIEGGTAPVG